MADNVRLHDVLALRLSVAQLPFADALARQQNLKVEVLSGSPVDLKALELICDKFTIQIEDVWEKVKNDPQLSSWLNTPPKGTVRIIIPEPHQRVDDFAPLFLYHFEKTLTECRKNDPELPEPLIDITYVLLVKYLAYGNRPPRPIEDIVFQDIIELGQAIPFTIDHFSDNLEYDRREVYTYVQRLPLISQLFTGFAPKSLEEVPYSDGTEKHPLNKRANEMSFVGGGKAIHLKRRKFWSFSQFCTVLSNLALHDNENPLEDENVIFCLVERLKKKSEKEIGRSLEFTNPKEYNQWLKENLIDFEAVAGWSQVEKRETARKELGLPTDLEIEVMVTPSSIDKSDKVQVHKRPLANELIFSHGFRSLSINNKDYVTTPKQASILEFFTRIG